MFGLYLQPHLLPGRFPRSGLKAFTAAVVGGIGSIPGAMLGGLLVGLVESFATGYVGRHVADLVVFGLLIGCPARPADRPPRHPRIQKV